MNDVTRTAWWKNFSLGEELSVAGTFIYNGVRRFHELQALDYDDELFEVFYNLSVGIERLMKICIVLLAHDDALNQNEFEKSLITHNHQELLTRIRKYKDIKLSRQEHAFLELLTRFYKDLRYDRFSLRSLPLGKEKSELFAFLVKQLRVEFNDDGFLLGNQNTDQYRKFIRKIVVNISNRFYELVRQRAGELNLYTYELRHGSKAATVFLGAADIPTEDILWKELLIFLMNTKETSGYLKFLRNIEPLDFDPALVDDYLDCFQSNTARAQVVDELESLYEDIADKKERFAMIKVIGAPGVNFDDHEEDFQDDCENDPINE